MIEISICIPTCNRPSGLERLLSSIVDQRNAPSFEVVIVDNDPARSAEAVAMRFSDRLAIIYDVEAVRGVSTARNLAVTLSRAPLLAFIDDDEWADQDWLAALHAKMSDPGIAAAVGVRRFVFDQKVPAYRRECAVFHVPDFADGEPLTWSHALIGNSCLRRAALPDSVRPFDPALDLVGGEDSHLFARIIEGGGRVVGARGALTHEYRSAERTTIREILRRAFRSGGTGVEIDWLAKPVWRRIGFGLEAALRCLVNIVLSALWWPLERKSAFRRLVIAAGWAGRAARIAGWRLQEFTGAFSAEVGTDSAQKMRPDQGI